MFFYMFCLYRGETSFLTSFLATRSQSANSTQHQVSLKGLLLYF